MPNNAHSMKAPLLLIFHQKDGRLRISVESRLADESSVQLNYFPRGLLKQVEVIDANGSHFQVEPEILGVNWLLYARAGILAPIAVVLGLIFLSIMVRIKLSPISTPTPMSLAAIKEKICKAIRGNPDVYTWAPPEEIIQRVTRARTVAEVIRRIVRD